MHQLHDDHEDDAHKAKIRGKERNTMQRKFLEGIITLKEKSKGIIPLNNYNQIEPWQPTVYTFLRDCDGKPHCVHHLHDHHAVDACKNRNLLF